jgi:hypothetical protein
MGCLTRLLLRYRSFFGAVWVNFGYVWAFSGVVWQTHRITDFLLGLFQCLLWYRHKVWTNVWICLWKSEITVHFDKKIQIHPCLRHKVWSCVWHYPLKSVMDLMTDMQCIFLLQTDFVFTRLWEKLIRLTKVWLNLVQIYLLKLKSIFASLNLYPQTGQTTTDILKLKVICANQAIISDTLQR